MKKLLYSLLLEPQITLARRGHAVLSPEQEFVFRRVIAPNGHVTPAMHGQFWQSVEHDGVHGLSASLMEAFYGPAEYQLELWKSALASHDAGEVTRTDRLCELAETRYATRCCESTVNGACSAQAASCELVEEQADEPGQQLLEAAARQELMEDGNGEVFVVDRTLVTTIMADIQAMCDRLVELLTPDESAAGDPA